MDQTLLKMVNFHKGQGHADAISISPSYFSLKSTIDILSMKHTQCEIQNDVLLCFWYDHISLSFS